MSNTDSFIEEVTEEVRRDRLFRLFRRYGWIALAVVVLIVGGASWNEWQKAQARNAAQALGDEILGALDTEAPDARAEALAALAPEGEAAAIARLLAASAAVEAGDRDAAIETLNGVATDAAAAPYYRDLAQLKSLILQTDSMAPGTRIVALQALAAPGAPFRLLAEEQIALAEIESGDRDAAIARLRRVAEDTEATQGLRRRVADLILALGGQTEAG
jgi:hypothetical protein